MVRCRSPLNQQTLGAIKCLSEQEVAALFVESSIRMFGGREKCVVNNVTIRKLRFRDIDLKRVEVEGFDGEPFKIEVHAAEVKKGKAKGGSSQAARKLDLCSDLLQPTCRTPAAPAAVRHHADPMVVRQTHTLSLCSRTPHIVLRLMLAHLKMFRAVLKLVVASPTEKSHRSSQWHEHNAVILRTDLQFTTPRRVPLMNNSPAATQINSLRNQIRACLTCVSRMSVLFRNLCMRGTGFGKEEPEQEEEDEEEKEEKAEERRRKKGERKK